eukprot:1998286-Amphidinium_carterae.1
MIAKLIPKAVCHVMQMLRKGFELFWVVYYNDVNREKGHRANLATAPLGCVDSSSSALAALQAPLLPSSLTPGRRSACGNATTRARSQ